MPVTEYSKRVTRPSAAGSDHRPFSGSLSSKTRGGKVEELGLRREIELIRACLAGEPRAWSDFVDAYGSYIWSLCLSRGLSRDLAEDALQSTFVAIWRSLRTLRDPGRLLSWVTRIAFREVHRTRRKATRSLPSAGGGGYNEAELVASDGDPVERLERMEDAQLVREAIAGLPKRYRFLLRALFLRPQNVSYDVLSSELGLPRGSLGPMRARGLELLRRRLLPLREQFFVSSLR